MTPDCLALVAAVLGLAAGRADDILLADFEAADYAGWTATGTAFGPGPARGTLPNQMAVTGHTGRGLVNTYRGGDAATGTLTSPPFTIGRKYLTFRIGGGKDPDKLALTLLVGGKVVRTATGPNDRPGGSEELSPGFWDVGEFAGQTGTVRIVDEATGPWGHLNVDHLVLSDRPPPDLPADATREFTTDKRYLLLPVKNGAKKRAVTLLTGGRAVVRNEVELADRDPDWWAPLDVSAFKGQPVTLKVDKLPANSAALKLVEPSDTLRGEDPLYREPLRGQFHFSARRGWLNDPNGLVYFNGEYHLFFQHNPYGWGWGNMHWGHAVSPDLVHWRELGEALLPDALGPMFSGSAVVDAANTSGLGRDGKPPLVLLYTAAGDPTVQCLAHGTDGRTFTKLGTNPVVKQVTGGNRDPKVVWHAPTRKWVMVLYVELKGRHTVHFYTSPDLKAWTLASVLEGGTVGKDGYLFECPDLFELPAAGGTRWVLLGANSEYAVGSFDGTAFKPEAERLPGHHGKGFYAPQTFADIPAADGRRIQIGWFQTETRGMPFNQSMTVPHELKLVSTAAGPRLARSPVKELEKLRAATHTVPPQTLAPGATNPLAGVKAELLEVRVEFEPAADAEVTLTLRGATVGYDAKRQEVVVNGRRAPAPLRDGKVRLTVYVDRTGLEVFAADGLTYVPLPVNLKPADRGVSVTATGGPVKLTGLTVHELRPAWPGG